MPFVTGLSKKNAFFAGYLTRLWVSPGDLTTGRVVNDDY